MQHLMHLREAVIGSRQHEMQLHRSSPSQSHIDMEDTHRTLLMLTLHVCHEAFHWLQQAQIQDGGDIYRRHPVESHNSKLVAAWSELLLYFWRYRDVMGNDPSDSRCGDQLCISMLNFVGYICSWWR